MLNWILDIWFFLRVSLFREIMPPASLRRQVGADHLPGVSRHGLRSFYHGVQLARTYAMFSSSTSIQGAPMPRKPRTDNKPKGSRRDDKGKHPGVAYGETGKKGRPPLEIDEAMLYEAARTHASFEQLARIFGVGAQSLSFNAKYREIILKARAEKQRDLLAAQFQTAISDRNPTMQIWLGKQYLEQRDVLRTEHSGPDGKPIQHEKTKRVIAIFPENGRRRAPKAEDDVKARAAS